MRRVTRAALAAAACAAAGAVLTAAGPTRLTPLVSVYADAKEAPLHLPEGVACGPKGVVIVGDTGNDRLVRFTYLDRVPGAASVVQVPQLTAPTRVQIGSKGEIYALDGRQRRIVHLGADGRFREFVSFEGAPAPATIVPKSFVLDAADVIYALDEFSGRVLVLGPQGKFDRAIPVPQAAGFIADLAVDFEGNLLLVDSVKRRLFIAAKGATAFTELGGDLSASVPTLPASLAASRGLLFVVEGPGSTIDAFGRDGKFLARLLAEGRAEGTLEWPAQMCVNEKDEVFVADRDNSRLQIFQLTR